MSNTLCVKFIRYKVLILVVVFLQTSTFLNVFSQSKNGLDSKKILSQYIIEYYTTDEGLPNNAVLDIDKSEDGKRLA